MNNKYHMLYSKFDLPKPSDTLIELIKQAVADRPPALEAQRWHRTQQPSDINPVAGEFFYDEAVGNQCRLEYQQYFSEPILPSIGVLKNTTDVPACYPAHSDRVRIIHVNYYVDLGGDDVTTVFYDKVDPVDDEAGGYVLSHSDLPKVTGSIKFKSNQWYLFNSRNYHSVENITGTRYILGFSFKYMLIEDFLSKYESRIIEI